MDNVLNRIMAKEAEMSKKEQVLAKYIEQNYRDIIEISVHELAARSKISAATIVRFCKTIGVDGFSDLKLKISAMLGNSEEVEYAEIKPGEKIDSINTKMATRLKTAIDVTSRELDQEEVTKAVEAIHKAKQIQVFGVGASKLPGEDFEQKFLRIGKFVTASCDFHIAAAHLASMTKNDLLIAISNSGNTKEVIDLLQVAKEFGVKSILLTSNSEGEAVALADQVLMNQSVGEPILRSGATTSLISQLFIVDILIFSYLSKYNKKVKNNLNNSRHAINTHKEGRA